MPELPEVETIRRGIEKYLVGHTIENVDVKLPKIVEGDTKNVVGAKIIGARRVGKGLLIDLSNNYTLAIHIKLTGQLVYRGGKTKNIEISKAKVGTTPNNFTHLIFKLKAQNAKHKTKTQSSKVEENNAYLYYNDQRRFGWIKIVKTEDALSLPFFKSMGPEPSLSKDTEGQAVLTLQKFKQIVSKPNMSIKPLLMDQKRIGGIGNIYANDALHLAKIDPRRKAKDLTPEEIEKLYHAILSVMEKSFKYGGASELSFVNILGQEGEYQRHSLVYGKKGKPCKNCGTTIVKFFQAGRGTFMCPKCQA